jgi:hypothetical protein
VYVDLDPLRRGVVVAYLTLLPFRDLTDMTSVK